MAQQTHDLTFAGSTVVKCYRHWDRDEPEREWTSLRLLAECVPGLAPEPLDRTLIGGRPAIVMSRLAGEPLGGRPLSESQAGAVGEALRRLHEVAIDRLPAVMAERLTGPSTLRTSVAEALAEGGDLAGCTDQTLVAEALTAAREWLAPTPVTPAATRVLGRADGNLANCLWDGMRVRLVDFEDAGASEAAFELADHAEHISFRQAGGDPALLVTVCGLAGEARQRFTAFQKDFAAFWLAMLLPGNRGFARNPPGTTEWQARRVLALLGESVPLTAAADTAR